METMFGIEISRSRNYKTETMQNRRTFVKSAALAAAAISAGKVANAKEHLGAPGLQEHGTRELFFDISLAQWSLNKKLFGKELDNLDFPAYTKEKFDIHAVEYVNQFFKDADTAYIKELLKRTQDIDVKNVLIMIDGEGNLGDTDEEKRKKAVENHYRWVEHAHILGCHSIRVNAGGRGTAEEVGYAATRSLRTLSQFAADYGINVIVENHGGYSSRASWLVNVIRNTGMVNCGVLPDFGNFIVDRRPGGERYDPDDVADITLVDRQTIVATPSHQDDRVTGASMPVNRRHLRHWYHSLANRGVGKADHPPDTSTVEGIDVGTHFGHLDQ